MKRTITFSNGKSIKVSTAALAAAYCGAYCNGHILAMGHATEDHQADFKHLYNRHFKRMKSIVKEMGSEISSKCFLNRSPSMAWGMLLSEDGN